MRNLSIALLLTLAVGLSGCDAPEATETVITSFWLNGKPTDCKEQRCIFEMMRANGLGDASCMTSDTTQFCMQVGDTHAQ